MLTARQKTALIVRNWLFGYCIQKYEFGGIDRAEYGEKVLESLAKELQQSKIPSSAVSSLKLYKQFYQSYKIIGQTVSSQSKTNLTHNILISPENLVKSLSFSHFAELMRIEDSLKRNFYEFECIKSNWSIRELKRQISSLYYERTAISKDKQKLIEYVRQTTANVTMPKDIIRDPYVFEFLGLKPKGVMYESESSKCAT